MRFKQDIPTFNASIYMRTNSSVRKSDADRTRKNICEFMIHASNSVSITIDAETSMRHCIIVCTASLIAEVQ
jgi:hypothetical protein